MREKNNHVNKSTPTVIRKQGQEKEFQPMPHLPLPENAIRDNECGNCCYYRGSGYCKRFPVQVVKGPQEWCGEHKRKIT
jgi:hypothetical protein